MNYFILGLGRALLIACTVSVVAGYAQQAQQGGQRVYSSGRAYDQNLINQQGNNQPVRVYNNQQAWESAHGVQYGKNGLPAKQPYSSRYCRNLKPEEAVQMYKNGANNQFGGPQQQQQSAPANYYVPGSNSGGGAASYGSNTSSGQPYYTQTGK